MEEMLELIKQLEACGYTCEAGPLENNIDRLAEQGYEVNSEMLELIAEAEYEYLEEAGCLND